MNRTIRALFVALLLLAAPERTRAEAYNDENQWRLAAGSFAVENFDGLAMGTSIESLPSLGIKFDPLDDGTFPTVQAYASTGGVVRS